MRDLWGPHVRNLALEKGLLKGHSDYTRFIILGRSRVGSNLLRGLLNSHSQITVFGEIFQNDKEIGYALPGYRQSKGNLSLFHSDPVRFLESKVFGKFPLRVAAVGFKIFYYHAQSDGWAPVWEYLQQEQALKVIHIKRGNILKTHYSRQRAAATDVWVNVSGAQEAGRPITLDYEKCLADFTQTRQWEKEYDDFFAGHDKIEVLYEDLAAGYEDEMERIQAFLGVRCEPVTPQTYKQRSRPLSESIANYFELKAQFEGTPWEGFFEE